MFLAVRVRVKVVPGCESESEGFVVLYPDAVEQLKELTLSEGSWSPAYEGMEDVDQSKVPQCTEDLMMLIRGITGQLC